MDYEEMSQKKLEEQQKRRLREQERLEAEERITSVVKALLTEEARARLNNVGLVNQELYLRVVQAVAYLHQAGQLNGKVSEPELKVLLEKLGKKREISIRRK